MAVQDFRELEVVCPECHGDAVWTTDYMETARCAECDGEGVVLRTECAVCGGLWIDEEIGCDECDPVEGEGV